MRRQLLAFLLLGTSLSSLAQQITKYEYWFDQDEQTKITQTTSTGSIELSVDASKLNRGIHSLAFRAQDSEKHWSAPATTYFLRPEIGQSQESFSRYEYWIDTNTADKVQSTNSSGLYTFDVDASALTQGLHTVSFRATDQYGSWSAPVTSFFMVPTRTNAVGKATMYEYWLDNDLAGKVTTNLTGSIVNLDIDASKLTSGMHTFSFRCINADGRWSAPQTGYFLVTNHQDYTSTVSTYEYWLDGNYSEKHSVKGSEKVINLSIDTDALCSGMHSLAFRTSDQYGKWSAPQTSYFFVSKEKRGKQDVRAYRYWFNDASANAVVEQVSPAVIPFTLNTKLTVSDIITEVTKDNITMANDGEGRMKLATKNVLHTQYGTTDGRWGEVSSDTFAVILNEKTVDLTDFIVNTQASSNWQGWTTSGTVTGIQNTQTWTDGHSYFRLGSTSKSEWDGSMEQTIFGLPAGTYILTAKGRAATEVEAEISVNGFSESIPANGTEGGELGNGWSECSIVFTTDGQPFVLKASGSAKSTGKWMDVSDFILTYSNSANASLQVSLPETTDMQQYRNLTLSLKSVSSRLKLTTSSARSYTFQGLAEGGSYTLTLQNRSGQIVAEKTDIKIAEGENAVTLDDLKPMGSVTATVIGKDGQDLTSKALITWQTPDGEYINEGNKLSGLVSDNVVCYNVVLGDSLGVLYKEVTGEQLTVRSDENAVIIQLQLLQQNKLSGKVVWETGYGSTATISAIQKLNGRYNKTQLTKVGTDGNFTLDAYCDSLHLVISADGYLDCIVDTVVTATSESLGSFALKEITGMVVEPQIAYKESRQEGDDTTTEDFFADFNNVDYQLKNIKTGTDITEYRAQNGQIIILGGAADGDEVSITLHSRKGEYADACTTVRVKSEEKATAQFEIVEYGGIKAEYTSSDNKENIIALYNASGELIRTGNYSGGQHEFLHLSDGQYSILSMGKTLSLGNIQNLVDISTVGLKEGTDYLLSQAEVRAGKIRKISYDCIPSIDEALFYYTGSATSFIANKSRVVVGNYVTLTARLDFKEEYAEDVEDLSLVVSLPDGCEYVPGSAIIGNAIAPCAVEDGRVIISLNKDNYQERIRFCVIPVTSGDCMPTAFASFTLDKDILQPIGSAAFTAEDLSIVVPDVTAKPEIPVSGMALPYSSVTVYDGNVVIASTSAKADGTWMVKGELVKAYNLSIHDIHAEVKTPQDICMSTESKSVQYDQNAIEVKTVTMINTAHTAANLNLYEYRTVFDFQNPEKEVPVYWYWPSYPDFTFVVDFTNNDPELVRDVALYVFTSNNDIVTLHPKYDDKQNAFVVSKKFYSGSLPVNVSVDFHRPIKAVDNTEAIEDILKEYNDYVAELDKTEQELEELRREIEQAIDDPTTTEEYVDSLVINYIYRVHRIVPEPKNPVTPELSGAVEKTKADGDVKHITDLTTKPSQDYIDLMNSFVATPQTIEQQTNPNGVPIPRIEFTPGNMGEERHSLNSKWELVDQISDFENSTEIPKILTFKNKDTGSTITVDASSVNLSDIQKDPLQGQAVFVNFSYSAMDLLVSYVDDADRFQNNWTLITEALKDISKSGLSKSATTKLLLGEEAKAFGAWKSACGAGKLLKACGAIVGIASVAMDISDAMTQDKDWTRLKGAIAKACDPTAAEELYKEAEDHHKWVNNRNTKKNSISAITTIVGIAGSVAAPATGGLSLSCAVVSLGGATLTSIWGNNINKTNEENWKGLVDKIHASGKCPQFDEVFNATDFSNIPKPPFKPTGGIQDPSGYVYEAVSSNRLEGVTATIYQKVTTKDMYGDEHESIVKWDAEPYSQKNPVKTDFNGLYAWDVPDGLWQVKFEKEGYETVYSEWLPVPPPQLDINVPMYQSVQPEVVNAHGFESGVDFTFSKYMRPESFAEGMVTVSSGGTNVSGALQMLNIEQEPLDGIEFASHIKFVPETPFQIGEEVTLTIHKEVKSYVGVQMEKDYEVNLIIEPEIKAIEVDSVLDVSYNDSISVTIKVLSVDAAKGKTLTVSNLTPSIIKTDAEEIAIEDDGTATITIKGILPGNAALLFSIEGSDLTAMTQINVAYSNTVSSPKASIPTGSAVEKGTLLTLTCETEGATIYYTTDDTCPCDEATRLTYTEPIIINESVTIKAIAVTPDMADSETVVIMINLFGDVNGDKYITTEDVEGIVNLMLNNETKGLNEAAADVNKDGIISIADAVQLINVVMQNRLE